LNLRYRDGIQDVQVVGCASICACWISKTVLHDTAVCANYNEIQSFHLSAREVLYRVSIGLQSVSQSVSQSAL
jgi:hypothetical protein